MNEELKQIKKYYGEKMMHLCRTLFPTILEEEGALIEVLLKTYEPNNFLYDDLLKYKLTDSFKDYIYTTLEPKEEVRNDVVPPPPAELLSIAGYKLYECHSEEEIQVFKSYYKNGEELCTFRGGRLDRCYVFFAVKDNAMELKRKNFKKPDRQDEYGTSVISIQFTKGDVNVLSIKNRYNHTVRNADATFSNNLDNVIEGLTESFRYHYNLNFEYNKKEFEIPGYVKANDGKYYKYNHEINNVYYCPNNIIIDNFEVNRDYIEKERYIVLDYFILDLKEKKIKNYKNDLINSNNCKIKYPSYGDSFVDAFNSIEKIYVKKDFDSNKEITIIIPDKEEVIIKINKYNQIISYKNNNIKEIGSNFLRNSKYIENIELNNVVKIGNDFMRNANFLRKILLSKVEFIGSCFLYYARSLEHVEMPMLQRVGAYFLNDVNELVELNLPNLCKVGSGSLSKCNSLRILNVPKLEIVSDYFMEECSSIENLDFPNLYEVGSRSLSKCNSLRILNVPKLEIVSDYFMEECNSIENLDFPNLCRVGSHSLSKCNSLRILNVPKLEIVSDYFMEECSSIENLDFPNLCRVGSYSLSKCNSLRILNVPKLELLGDSVLYFNTKLQYLNMPNIIRGGRDFLKYNQIIDKSIYMKKKIINFNKSLFGKTIKFAKRIAFIKENLFHGSINDKTLDNKIK